MKLKDVEKVLYFESFMVIEPGLTKLTKNQLLSEEEYLKAQEEYGEDAFESGIGAEAIRELLLNIDLKAEKNRLRGLLTEIKSKVAEERTVKRLKLIESFIESGNKPECASVDMSTCRDKATRRDMSRHVATCRDTTCRDMSGSGIFDQLT